MSLIKSWIDTTVRIARLGTPRERGKGLRIGTVRRPPRGVPKAKYATGNWYDVWLTDLAPSPNTGKPGQRAETEGTMPGLRQRTPKP